MRAPTSSAKNWLGFCAATPTACRSARPTVPASPERCSRRCPDIPVILSNDPVNHPLEARIAPLVDELTRLEGFHPCWSCEGHHGPDGALWKIPRVWFYSESLVHLRVLADAVKELHLTATRSVLWRVVLTSSDEANAGTTFSLEPDLDHRRPRCPPCSATSSRSPSSCANGPSPRPANSRPGPVIPKVLNIDS